MRTLIVTILSAASLFATAQNPTYKVKKNPKFVVEQKKDYQIPGYDQKNDFKPINPGPVLGETYIDDADIKTLADMEIFYPVVKVYMPEKWPKDIDLTGAKYMVLTADDGTVVPVIGTKGKVYFTFLLEEGILAFDVKRIYEKDGKKRYAYDTVEIEKVKK